MIFGQENVDNSLVNNYVNLKHVEKHTLFEVYFSKSKCLKATDEQDLINVSVEFLGVCPMGDQKTILHSSACTLSQVSCINYTILA